MLISSLRADMFEQVEGLVLEVGDRGHRLSATCWVNGVCDAGPAWRTAPPACLQRLCQRESLLHLPCLERGSQNQPGGGGIWGVSRGKHDIMQADHL